jgi:transcriptional regulator with XRE-family HTH domain
MFNEWMLQRLQELTWSQADLARASGLTRGAVSNYINGRIPDEAALRKIAKAFKLPPETVFRAAGILPTLQTDAIIDEIAHLARQLPPDDVQDLIDLARSKIKRHERTDNLNRKTQPVR